MEGVRYISSCGFHLNKTFKVLGSSTSILCKLEVVVEEEIDTLAFFTHFSTKLLSRIERSIETRLGLIEVELKLVVGVIGTAALLL